MRDFSVKALASIILCAALLHLGACSDNHDSRVGASAVSEDQASQDQAPAMPDPAPQDESPQDHAVGMTSMTFIDTSRPTAAHGTVAEASSRTIETTIVYPAEGMPGGAVMSDAPVDTWAAPFPLIVLSHGLGGSVEYLLPLAQEWAAAGYVVALPRFPLTSNTTMGGPVAQDVENQPADVSFVIDMILADSNVSGQLLSNSVDSNEIAASGHSNGGITTYGLVANSCCRDERIGLAIILSGVVSPFAGGESELSNTPPILVVHGVNDIPLIYNQAVLTYNELLPPKGLLTLEEAGHGDYLNPDDPVFDVVAEATVDFLNSQFRGDIAAEERLPEYQIPGVATMHWAPNDTSNVPVDLLPEPETNRQAFLSASDNLIDGQVITVTWSGFLPGKVVNIIQCIGDAKGGASTCDLSGGSILYPNPEGMGSLELVVHTGPIGDAGVCDSDNPCTIIVNDAGLIDEEATVYLPITFVSF